MAPTNSQDGSPDPPFGGTVHPLPRHIQPPETDDPGSGQEEFGGYTIGAAVGTLDDAPIDDFEPFGLVDDQDPAPAPAPVPAGRPIERTDPPVNHDDAFDLDPEPAVEAPLNADAALSLRRHGLGVGSLNAKRVFVGGSVLVVLAVVAGLGWLVSHGDQATVARTSVTGAPLISAHLFTAAARTFVAEIDALNARITLRAQRAAKKARTQAATRQEERLAAARRARAAASSRDASSSTSGSTGTPTMRAQTPVVAYHAPAAAPASSATSSKSTSESSSGTKTGPPPCYPGTLGCQ